MNIKELIERNPLTRLNKDYQTKFINRIKDAFTEDQQKMFVGSFYCYLNYNAKNDFVIDFESTWKWLGFSRKEKCKRLLHQHFIENVDYKVTDDIRFEPDEKAASPIGEASFTNKHGGHNKETILLTVNTFKKLCLKSNTKKADEIHDYFIKLEEVFQEIINEESSELRDQLEQKNQIVSELKQLVEQLENKPDTEGFHRNQGFIYLIKDTSKQGHYKIGFATDPQKRLGQLNVSSSTYSLEILCRFETCDKDFSEKIIHSALQPFRIVARKEWFFFKNDYELAYAIKTIKECIIFTNQFNLLNYEHLKITKIDVKQELMEIDRESQLKNTIQQEMAKNIKRNAQNFKNKTGNYKGVCWVEEKQKWKGEIKKDYKIVFLGYFDTEKDAAMAYNDHALYLNQTESTEYSINEIENYIPDPRNVAEKNQKIQQVLKSSNFTGVSYDQKRNYYIVSIKHKDKTYSLGHHIEEIECAKLYNQQAGYFNNIYGTNYILNDIPDYNTVPCDIYSSLQLRKSENKSSKYIGVRFNKQASKYKSCVVHNKKQIHIGTFINEIDAAKAYNKKVSELNELFNTKYKLNDLDS
jgi:phage anti-repressor protein